MDAREEFRRFGRCSLDGNLLKIDKEFWGGVQKGLREMKHRSIREEVAFNKQFPPAPVRRSTSFIANLVLLLPVLLMAAFCLVMAWRLSVLLPS